MIEAISEMSFKEAVAWIIAVLGGLSVVIEITPIKVNPWSWAARKIGRAINAELLEKVDSLEKDLTAMQYEELERDAKENRKEILKFGDELLHGMKHSKENFDRILMCITEYGQYCELHDEFKNNVTEEATKHIISTYEKCMRDHDFL